MKPNHIIIVFLASIVLATGGCSTDSYDLPDSWQSASHADLLYQGPCDSSASNAGADPFVAASLVNGQIRLVYSHGQYRCDQALDAFVQETSSGYKVLIQPKDMDPATVAKCMCSDTVRLYVGSGKAGTTVAVYQRPDRYGEDNPEPRLIAKTTAVDGHPDCGGLVSCDAMTPCPNEGARDESGDAVSCIALESCGRPVCVHGNEACMMECGTASCSMMMSYPGQIGCD